MKICSKCKNEKEIKEFGKRKDTKDGLHYHCKICRNNINKIEYYEKYQEKHKQHYYQNRDSKLEYQLNYSKENKNKILKYNIDYYNKNKKILYIKQKNYRKNYRNINKDNLLKYQLEYTRNQYRNDLNFKLKRILRSRFYQSLKNNSKKSSVLMILGCNISNFKKHLETLFKPEMNWDNWGKIWEIDHIKGCCNFDLTDIEQQKQCFHYINMQPLFKTTEIAESFGYNEIGNRDKQKFQQ